MIDLCRNVRVTKFYWSLNGLIFVGDLHLWPKFPLDSSVHLVVAMVEGAVFMVGWDWVAAHVSHASKRDCNACKTMHFILLSMFDPADAALKMNISLPSSRCDILNWLWLSTHKWHWRSLNSSRCTPLFARLALLSVRSWKIYLDLFIKANWSLNCGLRHLVNFNTFLDGNREILVKAVFRLDLEMLLVLFSVFKFFIEYSLALRLFAVVVWC